MYWPSRDNTAHHSRTYRVKPESKMKLLNGYFALLSAALLFFPTLALPKDMLIVNFDEASNHIGQTAVVKGRIVQVSLWNRAVFLDFGSTNPNEVFTAVSFGPNYSELASFEGKMVSVSGKIITYRDKPAIIVSSLAQLVPIDDPKKENDASTRVYAAGRAPPAPTLSLDQIDGFADHGRVNERFYLIGEFRVTASGGNRAVLRDARRREDESPRIVVEYPRTAVLPRENDHVLRDAARPYLVKGIRRAEGVITIYVREIIATEARKK